MSLSDDHYDQYMMVANTNQSKLLRRNRPSLTRQPDAIHDAAQVKSYKLYRNGLNNLEYASCITTVNSSSLF